MAHASSDQPAGAPAPSETWDIGNYAITHYKIDPNRLIVVFASAGMDGLGEPLEEFRGTLSRLGVSMAFVIDRSPRWFNHAETPQALAQAARIARDYRHAGVLGESMGGSGAIIFADVCPTADRILALTPQYSMAKPFIAFDSRFAPFGEAYPNQVHWVFATPRARGKTQILFGNTEWLDAVHAGMYRVEGFNVSIVDGAGHLVGQHLKRGDTENRLVRLIGAFCDFSAPFTASVVAEALGPLSTTTGMAEHDSFAAVKNWDANFRAAAAAPRKLAPPVGLVDLALRRPANQSSVSQWSRAPTPIEDAAGAVSGNVTASYGFHTDLEDRPWWTVELAGRSMIREVRIYNRLEHMAVSDRCLQFAIETADIAGEWTESWRKSDARRFGGADGRPLVWRAPDGLVARHIRIRLLGRNYLHFDAVEVFGQPTGP